MTKCNVYIDGCEQQYEGQYKFENDYLEVEIFNYHSPNEEFVPVGSNVKYREINIIDLRNKIFVFSPVFYNVGITYSLTQYERYRTNFYISTGKVEDVEGLSSDMKISVLTLFHPMLIQCYSNPSLQISYRDSEVNYKVIKNSEKKSIEIHENNIDKIEFGGMCTYSEKNNRQLINIESENFAKIYMISPIEYNEILEYINEFDIFMNAYCPSGDRSYGTQVNTIEGQCFKVIHKLLGKEKYNNKMIYKPIKLNFFEYIEKMYRNVNYRTASDRNKYILFEFKKPTSLEDQYTFYFRYIDLYMGEYLKQKTGKEPSNYDRLSVFVDENLCFFDPSDAANVDNLKNELNSLRNQYVHEGYYLPDNKFAISGKRKKFLYYKTMDYNWLFRIVQVFKLGAYKILYTKVLSLEIDDEELKNALKCWF